MDAKNVLQHNNTDYLSINVINNTLSDNLINPLIKF